MDAVYYIKSIKRLCGTYECCDGCPLQQRSKDGDCTTVSPEETVAIVEQWAKENAKTYVKDFCEKFPNAKLKNGIPLICRTILYGGNCKYTGSEDVACTACWNAPMEEQ